MSPLSERRSVETDGVDRSKLMLCSDYATGITGEVLHTDAGFHITGAVFQKCPGPSANQEPASLPLLVATFVVFLGYGTVLPVLPLFLDRDGSIRRRRRYAPLF